MKTSLFCAAVLMGSLSCGGAARKTGHVQSGLEEYVRQARSISQETHEEEGSLWTATPRLSAGFRDVKARQVADIVVIQVVESTSAVAEATTQSTTDSTSGLGFSSLFGAENKVAELPSLIDGSGSSQFSGDAATTRTSLLQTSITARVVEVFPNGLLFLEGNREIMINEERQIVTVRGVVRPEDVSPQNVVLSRNVAELEVQVEGRGIVAQAQEPGMMFKVLSGIWPF